jgi:hypothetical protein
MCARTPVDAYFFSVSAFKDELKALLLSPEACLGARD